MWKIKVLNTIKNKVYDASFETENESINWIENNLSNKSFGHPARSLYEVPEELQSLIISQEEILQSDEVTFRTLYHLKAEYEITGPTEVLLTDDTPEARQLRLQDKLAHADLWEKYYLYGDKVKKYFTYLINTRPITSEQKNSIQAMPEILAIDVQLKFGRLLQAKALAQALVADEALIFQEDIDKVCEFIDDLLA